MLTFSDGMSIDTSGEYRILYKHDGMYVVGYGMLCPVSDHKEAQELLTELRANLEKRLA